MTVGMDEFVTFREVAWVSMLFAIPVGYLLANFGRVLAYINDPLWSPLAAWVVGFVLVSILLGMGVNHARAPRQLRG